MPAKILALSDFSLPSNNKAKQERTTETTAESLASRVTQHPLLAGMDPKQLALLIESAMAVEFKKGEVIFREGERPLVALFGMMRAEDLPEWFRGQTWEEPALVIRTREGQIHPEYSAVKLAIGFPP